MKASHVLAALLAALTLPAAPAVAQFSASPAMIWVEGEAATATSRINIRNEGAEAAQLRVYVSDFEQDIRAEHAFLDEVGAIEGSCGARLRVTPDIAVLQPAESRELLVEVDHPSEPCWAVVFIQTGSGADQPGAWITQRIGVKVFAGDRSPQALNGEISAVEAVAAGGAISVDFDFRNLATTALRPTGHIELRALTGETVAQVEIEPFSVLPGHTRRIAAAVEAELPEGRYVAVPVIDFGGEFLAGGQGLLRIH